MNLFIHPDVVRNLALAILASFTAPALLLDGDLAVIAGSSSFYVAFALEPQNVAGRPVFKLGAGEWDVPQLRSPRFPEPLFMPTAQ